MRPRAAPATAASRCIDPVGFSGEQVRDVITAGKPEAHRQIDGVDVLRDVADGDEVHAGFGHGPDVGERDAARSLELHSRCLGVAQADGFAEAIQGKVVQQQPVGAGGKGLGRLRESLHFHLEQHSWTQASRFGHRSGDAAVPRRYGFP